ncbi:MAG TPA: amidohydrolase [Actinomycetota bacterium]
MTTSSTAAETGPPGATIHANAAVFTGVRARPWAEACAVHGGTVAGVGDLADLRRDWPGAVERDLEGATVLPGLIDAHNHFLSAGESLASLDLRFPGVGSAAALLRVVREAAEVTPPGETISGFGFDDARYGLPTLHELDEAAGDHRLQLFHVSGHNVLVNGVVLSAAGVDDGVEDPPGGRFVRDSAGRLTGLCLDAACGVVVPSDVDVGSHGPNFHARASIDALVGAVARANDAYLAAGLTCVADAQVTSRELSAYREARRRGVRGVRTVCMPLSHPLEAFGAVGLAGPFGDDRLAIGHLKVYADGSLTGGTAAFGDEVGARGQEASFFHEPDALVALIERAWSAGWRVAVHAQGDRAIAAVLDGFERGASGAPHPDPRPRIEHCGYPTPAGIERMRALDAIAVNQPSYLFDFGDAYAEMLGDAVHDLQPWRDELDAGVRVVLSSDSDVSSYRPLTTIANAMRRRTREGAVIGGRHRLTLEESLFAHTVDAAYALGLEGRLGSLEPGKDADLTIVGADVRSADAAEVEELPVVATVVAGETRYEA